MRATDTASGMGCSSLVVSFPAALKQIVKKMKVRAVAQNRLPRSRRFQIFFKNTSHVIIHLVAYCQLTLLSRLVQR